MHRSGTSALARALRVLGIDIGEHRLARKDNPKGFFENQEFVAINEALLAAQGMHWDSCRQTVPLCVSPLIERATQFLTTFCQNRPLAGLKDPRASRLLAFWRPLCANLDRSPTILLALRNPDNVCASLAKRDAMDAEKATTLWLLYTIDALTQSQGLPRLCVAYDNLLENPHKEFSRMSALLSLPINPKEYSLFANDFLERSLRHHTATKTVACTNPTIAHLAQRLYQRLLPTSQSMQADALDAQDLNALVATIDQRLASVQS